MSDAPSRSRRWTTNAGGRSPELEALIEMAMAGARAADIADQFWPHSGNGIRKYTDIFTRHATIEEKARRRAALKAARRNPHDGRAIAAPQRGGIVEPALRREARSMFEGMGECFANPPARPAAP